MALIYRGLSRGIEWFCRLAMPALIVMAFIILIRVLTLSPPDDQPNNTINKGLGYLWNPNKIILETRQDTTADWVPTTLLLADEYEAQRALIEADSLQRVRHERLSQQLQNPNLWLAAASQVFFSLSVGFGVIITYASYLRPEDDIVLSGLAATSANEFCEVGLGGLMTVPAGFVFLGLAGVAGQGTFGLGFNVLPVVFSQMPFGQLFGFLFFFLLFLAAVTSSLSMLQPGIAFLEESMSLNRRQSVAILGLVTGFGTAFVVYFSAGVKALDTLDFWVGNFLIFIYATAQILVFGWVMGVRRGVAEAEAGSHLRIPKLFYPLMKFVTPAFLLLLFGFWLVNNVLALTSEGQPQSYITDLVGNAPGGPVLVAWLSVGLIALVCIATIAVVARSPRYRPLQGTMHHTHQQEGLK